MTPVGEASIADAAQLCPLCGLANGCAMAAASSIECWCIGAEFGADLLARAANSAGAERCICARCASGTARPSPLTTPDAH
jgi:hypothetical protein